MYICQKSIAKEICIKNNKTTANSIGKKLTGKSSISGQAQILAFVVFLLLIPTTAIIAQNATLNHTQELLTGNMINGTLFRINATLNHTNGTSVLNESLNMSLEQTFNETTNSSTEFNSTTNDTKTTIVIEIPMENQNQSKEALNDTAIFNETLGNQTQGKENQTQSNETLPEVKPPETPSFDVEFQLPDRFLRGEEYDIRSILYNTGSDARGVFIEWVIPEYFESESREFSCGDMEKDSACSSMITVRIKEDAAPGKDKIKVIVRYEQG